jgi:Sugar phosphate isomerases/epimerases
MARLGGSVFVPSPGGEPIPSNGLPLDFYDPEKIARMHREQGYRAAYAPAFRPQDGDRIKAVTRAFAKEDVVLAETGYWENILDTDPAVRKQVRNEMAERFAAADEAGVQCFVTTVGAYTHGTVNDNFSQQSLSEDAFLETVEFTREILGKVNPKRTVLAYEPFAFTSLDSVERIERMLGLVSHPMLGVHLDLTNLLTSVRAFFNCNRILEECVAKFGGRIITCHIKDMRLKPGLSVILEEKLIGDGDIDLAAYLKAMHGINSGMPVMLEHLDTAQEFAAAAARLKSIAAGAGIPL